MARKKKVAKKGKVVRSKRVSSKKKIIPKKKDAWFRKRSEIFKDSWGFIPINWKGWVALILLIGLNIFSANYFKISELVLNNWLNFGVVFFLSLFIFIEISKKKTLGMK